jgi:hypothetical protein
MQLAIRLQFTMGSISPREVLRSKKASDFPMTEKEMAWQIEFFEQSGGRAGRTNGR